MEHGCPEMPQRRLEPLRFTLCRACWPAGIVHGVGINRDGKAQINDLYRSWPSRHGTMDVALWLTVLILSLAKRSLVIGDPLLMPGWSNAFTRQCSGGGVGCIVQRGLSNGFDCLVLS